MKQDNDCIFCKILSGQVPCCKILEDDGALAFMDIGPLAEGHLLLIPKSHYVTLDEMPADEAAAMLRHLPSLTKTLLQVTCCKGVNVLQNNGRVAHQLVPHVHFHIIPRNPGDEFHFNWPSGCYPKGRMEELAEAMRKQLRSL